MKRKELFFHLLQDELAKEGFKYLKSKNALVKKEDKNEFIIGYDLWPQFYRVELNLKVILYDIEIIKKRALGKLYDRFATIGSTRSYLGDDSPKEGSILTESEQDTRDAVKSELDFYHQFVKGYFKKLLDYKYIDQKLNSEPGKELYLAYNPTDTSILAIIVAKLVGNEKIEELFVFYRTIVLKFHKKLVNEYDLVVNYLKKMNN